MKKNICLFSVIMVAAGVVAQSTQSTNEWALSTNKWKITLKILDESSQPVPNAKVWVSYGIPPTAQESKEWDKVEGLTDTNGMFIASHRDTGSYSLGIRVTKDGYYQTEQGHDLGTSYKPELWNSSLILVLKKIGQPIAMYAKKEETKTPKENEPVGFDLMAGDWIAPFGTGKTADMFFTIHRKVVNMHEYDAELKVTFPNKGDGIAITPSQPDVGSDFKTSRIASENGYESDRSWHYSNSEKPESVFGYFLRVRTVLDENGNVRSALYGKINGDIRFYVGTKVPRSGIGFTYYLNPTPNSRNVEFDPKQNLLGGLKFIEQVTAP